MSTAETGAKVKELEDICPICGASPRKKGKCMEPVDLTKCPNKGQSCFNKDEEEKRIGCGGYPQGNIGYSTMLGNNIIIQMRSGVSKSSSDVTLSGYRDKVMKSYEKIFDEDSNKNIPDKDRKEILEYKLDEIKKNQSRIHPQDRNIHPLHIVFDSGFGTTQAHHIICSDAMNSEEWRKVCKGIGYNINCRLNGVFLPSAAAIACTAKVPIHSSHHDKGFTGGSTNYADKVEDIADQILKKARKKIEFCEDTKTAEKKAKVIIKKLNEESKNIFEKIRDFVWTITADGFDYMPGNPIGCSNHSKMRTKKKDGEILNIRKKHEEIAGEYLENVEEATIDVLERERKRKVEKYHSLLDSNKKNGLGDLDIYCKGGRKDDKNPNPIPREHKFAVDHFTKKGRYSGNKYTLIYGE